MATQDGKCGHPLGGGRKCNNRVRQGASACYMHEAEIQSGIEFEALDAQAMHEAIEAMKPEIMNPIPSYSFNNMQGDTTADLVSEEVGHRDTTLLLFILQAAENVRAIVDPTVPSNAIRYGSSILQKMTEELVSFGVDASRITRLRTVGAVVRGFSQIPIEDERTSHESLLIDEGKPHEFVVAPCIAALAPVDDDDLDRPVSERIPPGTPFTDYPWIASFDNFMQDGFINWMRDRDDLTDDERRELDIIERMNADPDFANAEILYGDEDLILNDIALEESKPQTIEDVISQAIMPSEILDDATQEDDDAYVKYLISKHEGSLESSGFLEAVNSEEDDDPFGEIAR